MRSPASVDLNFPESPIPPSCGWSEVTKTVRTTLLCLVVAVVAYLSIGGGEYYCWIWPSIDTRYASGYSERKFRQVEVGMTETQVVALIGRPLGTHRYWRGHPAYKFPGDFVWSYTSDGAAFWGDWAWLSREIIFHEGRVVQKVFWTYYD